MLQYSPKITTDGLVMCLDASNNKSYPTTDLPVKGGLVMWMDAADDTTFSYSSGTTVTQWRDKSGLNNHCVPLTAGPTRSSFLNSRKVLAFTTGQSIGSLSFTMETSANTVFVVSRLTGTTNSRVLTAYYNNWLLGHWGGNYNQYYAEGWIAYGGYAADTTWRMYMGDWGGSSNDVANAYSNGTLITNQTTSQASAGPKGLGINFQGGEPSTCEAAEIIVFNRVLSATERKQVNTYLGQKWGISNTDRSIIDLSGFNDNGLLGNGSTSNMPLFDYYNKGAFKFFASNKYIKLGNNTTINQFAGDFTVSLWAMAMAENSNYGNLIGDYYTFGVATTNEWQIMMNNSSAFLNVFRAGAGYIISNTSSGFSANTWINVVLTRVGSAITLYANNTVIGTATYSSVFGSATGSVNIGIDGNNAAEPFSGLISNVLIYQKGLSAVEVAQNYEAQKSKFATTIIQQGLVLNIDAANPYSYGGAGTTVYDTSNTALSWTATNTTYNSDPIKYLSFNGSNSSLVSSTSTAYDSQTITMECWCYPSSLSQSGFLFEKGAVNTQYSMFFNGDGVFYFRTISISTQDLSFTSSSYLTANAWNHIVCTYGSGTKTVYINGAQGPQQTSLTGTLPTGQTNQYIGKYGALGDNFPFNGRIAESRVYNIALSAAQVLQNYNATRTKYGR